MQFSQAKQSYLLLFKERTLLSYANTLDKLGTVLDETELDAIDLETIQRWLHLQPGAVTTKQKYLSHLKAFFNWARDENFIARNPIPRRFRVAVPEETLAERILSREEVEAMLIQDTATTPALIQRNRLLLKTLYLTGLRVGEVCALCWRHLSESGTSGQLSAYGKGGKTRHILLPGVLWQELQAFRGGARRDAPVFGSKRGRALTADRVCEIVKDAARLAAVENADAVAPHWLRHSFASHSLDAGVPIHLVQRDLGHASVATTSKYLHARPGQSVGEALTFEASRTSIDA